MIDFCASSGTSLGVEWELQLVDPTTRQLTSGSAEILDELGPGGEHPTAKHELLASCVEVITGINSTVAEAEADLAGTVAQLRRAADHRGLALMCAGTHPLTDWRTQTVSPQPRYLKLVEDMQWLARRMAIFGVHVHVGVRSPDKAIHIVNALTSYVPHFLGLSGSSPYWKGDDTGLVSARSKVFEGLPTAGLPYLFDDWKAFEGYMQTLLDTGTIQSVKEVWWDIRPHPDFGTVELRVCDGLPTLWEVGMVAALTQSLVEVFDREIDRGYTLPRPKEWVVRENKWRAVRWGLDAAIIGEDGVVRPLRDSLRELVHELRPTAERLGCEQELTRILDVVAKGASVQRQRRLARGRDLDPVVDGLLAEFDAGVPAW
ncbi:MAG: glutamate--cysteine ligase [Frankiales bacterium]|nr:glutamate--cysteine ligase [Frankiales bacterium]